MKRNQFYFLVIILSLFISHCASRKTKNEKSVVSDDRPVDPMALESWQYKSKDAWAPPARLERGFKLCSQKKALQAIREWQQKLSLHKQDKIYWYALGNCYSMAGQDSLSTYAFKVGLGLFPMDVYLKHNLALSYMKSKDYQKSFPMMMEVVKASPNSILPQFHLGQLYFLFSNYQEARNIFLRVERSLPEQYDVKQWIARSSYHTKDYVNAAMYFSLLPSYSQKDMENSNLYAHALMETGKFDKAMEVLTGEKSNARQDLSEFREKLIQKLKAARQPTSELTEGKKP